MESQAPSTPPERKGLIRDVLLWSIGYTLSNLRLWLLWSIPLVLFFAAFFYLIAEGWLDALYRIGQDAGVGLNPLIMMATNLATVPVYWMATAPMCLMVQRHILLLGKKPERSFLSTLAWGRLWLYVGVVFARGMLVVVMSAPAALAIVGGGIDTAKALGSGSVPGLGALLMVAGGLALLVFGAYVWLRLEFAPPLCAVGDRSPFRRSWEIMGGKVLKILLLVLALLLLESLVYFLYVSLIGEFLADNPSPAAALAEGVLTVIIAVAVAALSGRFLAHVRPDAAVGGEAPAALVPGHEPNASG